MLTWASAQKSLKQYPYPTPCNKDGNKTELNIYSSTNVINYLNINWKLEQTKSVNIKHFVLDYIKEAWHIVTIFQ